MYNDKNAASTQVLFLLMAEYGGRALLPLEEVYEKSLG
jgi:hypothetical protein